MIYDGSFTKSLKQAGRSTVKNGAIMALAASYLYSRHQNKLEYEMESALREERPEEAVEIDYVFTEEGVTVLARIVSYALSNSEGMTEDQLEECRKMKKFIDWMLDKGSLM